MFINIHTHKAIFDANVELVTLHPTEAGTPHNYSYGLHPWRIENDYEKILEKLRVVAHDRRCIAIGECGLDKIKPIDFETQIKVFETQIELANELDKPLIIHCVKAFNELQSVLKKKKNKVPVIVHGFDNNLNIAKTLLADGMLLSFGKALLTYASNASEVIKHVKRNNFFLETDDADVSIKYIYKKAAEILGIDEDVLQQQLKYNYQRVFKEEIL